MKVKLKILQINTQSRSVTVHVYTDALMRLYEQKVWPERVNNLMTSGRFSDRNMALSQVQLEFRPGWVGNVQIFKDPMPSGKELIDYLIANGIGSGATLTFQEKCLVESSDMSEVKALGFDEHEANIPDAAPVNPNIPITNL